ncbi:MAG: lanthionine synthetase C family protein [Solirubrobacteraceae bacterium]
MLWRVDEHEAVTERGWDEVVVQDAIRAIVSDAEGAESNGFWPAHPLDEVEEHERLCSLYLGSAGMIWGLWTLGSSLDCAAAVTASIERYREKPDFGIDAHPPSLWMGESGLLVVADRVGSPAADRGRLRQLVLGNREHRTWELMWGSPGTMLAARACGLEAEWHDSASRLWARWDERSDVWTQELYGQTLRLLGPAHGFAGNVHALRGYVSEDILRARVTRLMERTAGREDGLINWPPQDEPVSESASVIRVQWCHGAPGVITAVGDLIPRVLATGGAELIWRAGPLRKGPGLCHGTAGNGFAFLKLHNLTGDSCWMERARRFAMHAVEQVERERAALGRGRYTLWTGDIGVALYLQACLDARDAFPTIDWF